MRPRFIINIGVAKTIKAVGRVFNIGSVYEARIYYNVDEDLAISASGVCVETEHEEHQVTFEFSPEKTALLHKGVVSIDIFDSNLNRLVFRDTFALVRPNSLQLDPTTPTPVVRPVATLGGILPAEEGDSVNLGNGGLDVNTANYRILQKTDRLIGIKFSVTSRPASAPPTIPSTTRTYTIYPTPNTSYTLDGSIATLVSMPSGDRVTDFKIEAIAEISSANPTQVVIEVYNPTE